MTGAEEQAARTTRPFLRRLRLHDRAGPLWRHQICKRTTSSVAISRSSPGRPSSGEEKLRCKSRSVSPPIAGSEKSLLRLPVWKRRILDVVGYNCDSYGQTTLTLLTGREAESKRGGGS